METPQLMLGLNLCHWHAHLWIDQHYFSWVAALCCLVEHHQPHIDAHLGRSQADPIVPGCSSSNSVRLAHSRLLLSLLLIMIMSCPSV